MNHKINEITAYKFSDNFRIETVSEPISVIGCEHNKQEAEAVAKFCENKHGKKFKVVHNLPHLVQESKKFRSIPFRFEHRQEAFKELGVI